MKLVVIADVVRMVGPKPSHCLDNNTVERSIRPLALGRKNALFAGSDEGGDNWAVIATLIENCKLSGINPHAWLSEALTKLANGHPAIGVGELMPWTAVG